MNQLRLLPPEKARAKARASVRKFQLEKKRKEFEAKRQGSDDLHVRLQAAAGEGKKEEVERLLRAGADPDFRNRFGETALFYAAGSGWDEVIELLIEHGADIRAIDSGGVTPLMRAVGYGHTAAARVLVDAGSDVNAIDDYHKVPVMFAANFGSAEHAIESIKILLDAGANINAKAMAMNGEEKTALDVATQTLTKEFLVSRGAKRAEELK